MTGYENDNDERLDVDALRRTPTPPGRLEQTTVAALVSRGLVRRRSRATWLPAVAAVAVAFLLGTFFGTLRDQSGKPGYVLLLVDGEASLTGNADERVREYGTWASDLRRDGITITGGRLESALQPIGFSGEARDDIGGYFLFDADTEDAAIEIARTCPHLRFGGGALLGRVSR